MNARQLTDAQIAEALRAWVPDRAQAGLREQVLEVAGGTTQQRPLPSFMGFLSDADPEARRRGLLIAAALLVALALATAAAVGALRLFQGPAVPELSLVSPAVPELALEPPADLQAFVLSSYDRMPELPALAMTWVDDESAKGRIYVDRSGALRSEQYASTDATEPVTFRIFKGHHLGQLMTVGTERVWVDQDEAIGEDPRVYLLAELGSTAPYLGGPGTGSVGFGEPACGLTRDPSEAGNGTAASGWSYVGAESVAGRPAHHLACVGGDIWIDDETRLILRSRHQVTDDAGNPIPGAVSTIEVTEIKFGEQPATLFELATPEGVTSVPPGELDAYRCERDPVCAAATPTPDPTPGPTSSPTPTSSPRTTDPAGPGPLAWSKASLKKDWPGPLRTEPAGGAIVQSLARKTATYPDPSGDAGSDLYPWVDIRELGVGNFRMTIDLATNLPPAVDPAEQWIAYGIVVDDDRDGVPDRRFGIENIPAKGKGWPGHWQWMTDLHTGQTQTGYNVPYFDTFYPGELTGGGVRLSFGGSVTGGGTIGGLPQPLYAWASVIENGRVVATDYAPDVGWLDPKR